MKTIKPVLIFIPFIMLLLLQWHVCFAQETNRKSFYEALASNNLNTINKQLEGIENVDGKLREAYEGALMMKKAGLLNGAGKKLKEFKAGKVKLENSLQDDPGNTEFRFLRLMIQENAPGILGYNSDVEGDHAYLRKNFKTLPSAVQQVVLDYSKTSKILKPSDF
ncbi:MAG: hypothetical protein KF862_24015 [Chitinophagaceae bacterium]|nr:hypothetical protein [Chitinophagaceae bacterium]